MSLGGKIRIFMVSSKQGEKGREERDEGRQGREEREEMNGCDRTDELSPAF